MGETANRVQVRLCEELRSRAAAYDWATEVTAASTPVDVAGSHDDTRVLVELEWRRADPADNTAKLFRHLHEGTVDAATVIVVQLFTGYYDLARGGVSSKRLNAEFVGGRAADSDSRVRYEPVDLAIDPPKRGGDLPDDWESAVAGVADAVCAAVTAARE
ncbi:hypothetical protein [Halobaculum sp. MBLA0143]|uniref:hypothetical protein n=1 Tax=Halobaculum sp. MBLA0143 TaxID=3079933 RepID=UPI0035234697